MNSVQNPVLHWLVEDRIPFMNCDIPQYNWLVYSPNSSTDRGKMSRSHDFPAMIFIPISSPFFHGIFPRSRCQKMKIASKSPLTALQIAKSPLPHLFAGAHRSTLRHHPAPSRRDQCLLPLAAARAGVAGRGEGDFVAWSGKNGAIKR